MCFRLTFVVSLAKEETILFHKYAAIIAAIKELLRRQWSVNLLHFLKDGNACVDILAKMGNQHLWCFSWMLMRGVRRWVVIG